jgi:hypothetical protein
VLLSALVYQRFRPDVHCRLAQNSAVQLRSLLRETSGSLSEVESGLKGEEVVHQIIKTLSKGISRIELQGQAISAKTQITGE